MAENANRKYTNIVDRVDDQVGADVPNDRIKTSVVSVEGDALSDGLAVDVAEFGGTSQSGVDVADRIEQFTDALQSAFASDDQLRVDLENDNVGLLASSDQPLDVSGAEVDVDIATQTLSRIIGELELEDAAASGSYANIHRRGDAIQISVENDQVSLLKSSDQPFDVSAAEVDVDTATNTVGLLEASDQPFDVSAATVTITDDGSFTVSAGPLDGALQTNATDELRSRIHDSTGTQIDPATTALENALKANDADEFVTRITGSDGLEIVEEALDTGVAATDVALLTYLSRALNSVDQDELISRLTDSTGSQIDPDQSPDYPNTGQEQDLIGTGDLTIGPVSVERSQAVIIAANSDDGNTWSASVTWFFPDGTTQCESQTASDIGLSSVIEDSARLTRKGAQVQVTFTDESGGAQNNINAYVDAHR